MTTIALAGCPNCGKSAIFNALTGGNQKVGNYPGVTVEKKIGLLRKHKDIEVVDLPGTYSLRANSLDEQISVDILLGKKKFFNDPKIVAVVADASQLERTLGLALELKDLCKPVVLILNMMDLARKRGLNIDTKKMSDLLQIPVIDSVAIDSSSADSVANRLIEETKAYSGTVSESKEETTQSDYTTRAVTRSAIVNKVIAQSVQGDRLRDRMTQKIDTFVMHPFLGPVILAAILLGIFEAVFSWASMPMDLIEGGIAAFGAMVEGVLPEGSWFTDLIVNGIIAGVGSVLVFLPQILILTFFILLMEASGYMMRAAFLLDRMMRFFGLPGRAFVPLLSSFACAIPGVMAARTIKNPQHRLLTILVAPIMTCSARLPVYVLLIGAFIPSVTVLGFFNLQAVVMFGLFVLGVVFAVFIAFVFSKTSVKAPRSTFVEEMPSYKLPSLRNVFMQLWSRAKVFLKKAGTLILFISMGIWFLSTYPGAPADADRPAIEYSYAGKIGRSIEPIFQPIGFDWRISTGLIPGFAAREVMVGALATVFAVEDAEDDEGSGFQTLQTKVAGQWSLATGLALLMWYVFSPQCLATFAVVRRETNSRKWAIVGFVYLLVLAYVMSFLTFKIASLFLG